MRDYCSKECSLKFSMFYVKWITLFVLKSSKINFKDLSGLRCSTSTIYLNFKTLSQNSKTIFLMIRSMLYLSTQEFAQNHKVVSWQREKLRELQPMAVQYTGHVISICITWQRYCTAIGSSSGDIIRTICNYIINYIY